MLEGKRAFWSAGCGPFTKEMLLFALLSGFIVQTCLVYSDTGGTVRLSAAAVDGRRIWHRQNCQTCHQLHGFGGFLGPDLTNASARLERGQLDALLTEGIGQMPAFHLAKHEIDAVWAFLEAMNETGVGQARNPNLRLAAAPDAAAPAAASTPAEALHQLVVERGDGAVTEGFRLFRTGTCLSCHVLYARSSVGAPDLSISGLRLTPEEIADVLARGRPPKMPPPVLGAAERTQVQAFIDFMAKNRKETLARVVEKPRSFLASLPWWEFR